ncbi:MAG: tetratricopeptide repeat protein [Acidobacteriota bacterium]|nr:tetratricopeptide repeat protein [Acidobacteriota bacterium]
MILAMVLLAANGIAQGQSAAAAEGQRERAFTLEQQGQLSQAEEAWRAYLRTHPSNAEAYAHLGFIAARQQRYQEAVPLYRKALALNPSMPGLRLNLGLSLFKSGALKDAIATFTPLLKSEPPGSPGALRLQTLIGMADYGVGDYAAAASYLKIVTASDPQNLPLRQLLAQSCLWSKQYQCVLDVYHEILNLNAESAEADMLAGEAYDEMKDKADAVLQFRAAVKADPRLPNVHFGLGYLLWNLMQYDEAAKEFQAEIANNPDHAQALAYLADADIKLGHNELAAPLLEKAIRLDPKLEQAHLDLGILYSDAGRRADALREFKRAAELNPNDVNVHWRLARFYQAAGEKALAKAEFDKTRSLQKAADETIFSKLKAAQDKGKPAETPADAPLNK